MNRGFIYYYDMLPDIIKKLIDLIYFLCPKDLKFGTEYRRYYNYLRKTESDSIVIKEKRLVQNMKDLLIYCKANVPYYRNLFREIQFEPDNFSDLNELNKIPLLDKDFVIAHTDEFIADHYKHHPYRLRKITTGGTTGKQMVIYEQKRYTEAREQAYFDYLFSKEGYFTGKKIAVLRNDFLGDKIWKWDLRARRLLINASILNDERMGQVIDKLNKEKILYFHTYPSAIIKLCQYIKRTGHGLNYKPKAIFASSENIYNGQREFVEKYMKCKFHIHYGHSEKGAVAGWCIEENHYHIEYSYGYMELVAEGNNPIPCQEQKTFGEIVTTGFNNFAMPLIRYRTGDYAKYADHGECISYQCLRSIEGRWKQEMFITSDGGTISLTSINTHSNIFDRVEKYQFYQEVPGVCYIHVVKREDFTEKDAQNILKELQNKMGEKLLINIRYVDDIVKTKSGKYCYLIQNLRK